ncbi:MAG TPA: MFS transporter [Magnetospirillum sp.]|jgi:CP family cyanate transporter-like MFS transporter|nr:MFS transporter [Magnetospirillum sp.]
MTAPRNELAEDLLVDVEDNPAAPVPVMPRWMLAVAMLVVACNLRPPLTSVGPVLNEIRASLPALGGVVGLLTMLPVLCMGLAGPLAPGLARRWGAERIVLAGMGVLVAGLALRTLATPLPLFAGTAIVGGAIGVVGVLLPGLVKRDFRDHGTLMTGLFTMCLCWGAAFAAGIMVPLSNLLGGSWALALGTWAIPAVCAALVWAPMLPRRGAAVAPPAPEVRGLWRSPLAWQVTLFMGLQSSLAYAVFGWLAPILRDRGLDAASAGWLVSFSVVVQLPAALIAPILAGRARDQRAAVAVALGCTLAGLLGCLYAPVDAWTVWLWAAVLGMGQGACFSVALTLIVLRARDGHVAAQLSSMVQGVGYTLAAFCPMALGLLREAAGSWRPAGPLFVVVVALALVAGLGAGRKLTLSGQE